MDYLVRCTTFRSRDSPAIGATSGRQTPGRYRIECAPGSLATASRPTRSQNHLSAPHSPLYRQRQTFLRIFVEQRQQPQRSSVMSPRADKVVTPHLVGPLRPEPHAGTVVPPQPSSWPLFLRHFQSFPPPDSLYPLFAYLPAAIPQQRRDLLVHLSPVLPRQFNHRSGQFILVGPIHRLVPLCPSPLPQQPAGMPFRYSILLPVHAPPHNAAAQGLQVSLRHIPQYLLLYRQLRH